MPEDTLKDRVRELASRSPSPDLRYYSLTLLADAKGNVEWSCYSHWTGWADEQRRIELRAASIVRADRMVRLWKDLGHSYCVINDLGDMELFLLIGGHGLVEKDVAESVVPEFLGPQPVVQVGFVGFEHVQSLPKSAFHRAPTPAQRMRVLKRDGFRCRICGRRPADYVDVELHVHHIRPWAEGGVTIEANLITLCHTCHGALDPHHEPRLFGLISSSGEAPDVARHREEYVQGVRHYRQRIVARYSSSERVGGDQGEPS